MTFNAGSGSVPEDIARMCGELQVGRFPPNTPDAIPSQPTSSPHLPSTQHNRVSPTICEEPVYSGDHDGLVQSSGPTKGRGATPKAKRGILRKATPVVADSHGCSTDTVASFDSHHGSCEDGKLLPRKFRSMMETGHPHPPACVSSAVTRGSQRSGRQQRMAEGATPVGRRTRSADIASLKATLKPEAAVSVTPQVVRKLTRPSSMRPQTSDRDETKLAEKSETPLPARRGTSRLPVETPVRALSTQELLYRTPDTRKR
jgi:hypothetical protein